MNGADSLHVYGTPHFVYEAQKAFIPTIGDHTGETSRAVLQAAVKIISDFKEEVKEKCIFHIMTNAELTEKGMKWVADDELLIDFFSTDKTNLWDVIKTIIENLGRGEIFQKQLSTVITTLYVTLPLLNASAQITASDCV